jgi:hypothetical protein
MVFGLLRFGIMNFEKEIDALRLVVPIIPDVISSFRVSDNSKTTDGGPTTARRLDVPC